MSAEVNPSVPEMETTQEAVAQPTQPESAPNVSEEAKETPNLEEVKRRNDQEYNWAEARRKQRELEQKLREQEEKLQRLQQPISQEEDLKIDDDSLVEGKVVKDLYKEIKTLKNQIQQKEAAFNDERLQEKFPDFASVVSPENIEILKQKEPEIAEFLASEKDSYKQASKAYKWIKKLGISSDTGHNMEKEKAYKNTQKPVSVNAVSKQSAIGNIASFENGLTPELKAQLLKEMRECAKRA